jgi:hypothetical protein
MLFRIGKMNLLRHIQVLPEIFIFCGSALFIPVVQTGKKADLPLIFFAESEQISDITRKPP